MPKGVVNGRFLQALLATGLPVAVAKQVSKCPVGGEAGGAMPDRKEQLTPEGESVLDSKVDQSAARPLHPEVSVAPSLGALVAVATTKPLVSPQLPEASPASPSKNTSVPKRNLHKDGVTSGSELTDVAPSAALIVANISVALPTKPDGGTAPPNDSPMPEPPTKVAVVSSTGPKGPGGLAASGTKSSKAEARKAESSVPGNGHLLPVDFAYQDVPTVPPVASHDAAHFVREVPLHATGVGAVGSVASTASHPDFVAKMSGSASPQVEVGSQATDLKTLVATPNVLEVGIASGSHGWLKVRAEFAQTGEVAASVVAASASAAQSLHKELPGISAYLAGERVGVSSLVVNSAEGSAGAQDSTLNNGSAGTPGADGGSSHRGKDRPGEAAKPTSLSEGDEADASFLLGAAGDGLRSALHVNGNGGWLSVRV